jgi:colicin import membrane protein
VSSPLQPLATPREALHLPTADSPRTGWVMSLLAHALLVLALTLGVQWHTADPEGVSAELWSTVPQIAAAPLGQADGQPQPQPTPPQDTAAQEQAQQQAQAAAEQAAAQQAAQQKAARAAQAKAAEEKAQEERDAELARERDQRAREKRQQAEREAREKEKAAQAKAAEEKAAKEKAARDAQVAKDKAAKDKAAKEQAAKEQAAKEQAAKEKADKARQAKLAEAARQDQLRRMAAQLGSPTGVAGANGAQGSTGTAQRTSGPSASYAGRIVAYIRPKIVSLDSIDGNPRAVVEVRCAPDGTIIGRRLTHSSGNRDWDETVLRAIDRTGKLPRDVDGTIPPTMEIGFTPKD